jgi:Ca2+-transporting ATPase
MTFSQIMIESRGLSQAEAAARLERHGPNALPETRAVTIWQRVLRQFRNPLIYILLFALALDVAIWVIDGGHGIPVESVAIALILGINASLGVYQEWKAETAMARLKAMAAPLVWVLRDGRVVRVPSTELVPGDVARVEAGERVPADGVMIEAHGVTVDESVLTGESMPVDKDVASEVFSGTLLVRGKGYVEVTRTGAKSAMGRLATMIGGIAAEKTPLERRLEKFGGQIAYAILALGVVLTVGGIMVEGVDRLGHIFLFSVALAVAAIPEGLPAVLILALALGVERMAKRKAIVRRLSAVEALGSVTVIATDKTGTLTENRMHVRGIDAPDVTRALYAMVLANDAEFGTRAGDPLELALLDYASREGMNVAGLNQAFPRISTRPFDSVHKFMRVTVQENGMRVNYFKGAPEVLLARSRLSAAERQDWVRKALTYAGEGHRVLSLAWRQDESEEDVTFLGLVLLWDPPRPEVPHALRRAQDAGLRVIMITGDHPATAEAVARVIGIPLSTALTGAEIDQFSPQALRAAVREINIFARVTPEHKLRIVEALKETGEVVAVTGDGVNDAPALKRADVGVAMGRRGSDVSREVADLVLMDDNFATIVAAIEEGRSIYENIQKFVRFLFSTNLALILLVISGLGLSLLFGIFEVTGGIFLPLTAIQLLWINVIADGPPALALAFDHNPGVMQQRPRDPKAALLDEPSLLFIVIAGVAKALGGVALLLIVPWTGYGLEITRTIIFLYESLAQLVFAYPSRRVSVIPQRNVMLHVAVLFGALLQVFVAVVPGLRLMLGLEIIDVYGWGLIALAVLLSWGAADAVSWLFSARMSKLRALGTGS